MGTCTLEKSARDVTEVCLESDEVLQIVDVQFDENVHVASCDPYGCTCIAHEKCCGCLLQ